MTTTMQLATGIKNITVDLAVDSNVLRPVMNCQDGTQLYSIYLRGHILSNGVIRESFSMPVIVCPANVDNAFTAGIAVCIVQSAIGAFKDRLKRLPLLNRIRTSAVDLLYKAIVEEVDRHTGTNLCFMTEEYKAQHEEKEDEPKQEENLLA